MSSKRCQRRRGCEKKTKYDIDGAYARARKLRRETGQHIHAYPCPFGAHWHVGHKSARQLFTV